MAKLALLFVAAFCLVQIAVSARIEKRDTADQPTEITTESLLDTLKKGVQNTFSEDNLKKAKDALGQFGDKAKDLGNAALGNLQAGFKKLTEQDATATPAPAAAPAA